MDENIKQGLKEQLDHERQLLSDPFPAVWKKIDTPRRSFSWGAVAAAVVLVAGLVSSLLPTRATAADWAPVIDDLWQASETSGDLPDSWEFEGEEWNLLDLGDDQPI